MKIAITGGHLIDPANAIQSPKDLFIADDRIIAVGHAPEGFHADKIIDAMNCWIIPGIVDTCSYWDVAQHPQELTVAAKNGVTSMCQLNRHTSSDTSAKLWSIGPLTQGFEGKQLSEMASLKKQGVVAVSNGESPIFDSQLLLNAYEYAATFDLPVIIYPRDPHIGINGSAHQGPIATRLGLRDIPSTSETLAISRELQLIEQSGVRAHFSKLSSADSIPLIAHAQQKGLPVTADVSIAHCHLTDQDVDFYNANCHVLPPFRSMTDKQLLIKAIKEGVITAICSDHRPLPQDAKLAPFAQTTPGLSSIDCYFNLALRLADEVGLDTVIRCLTKGPSDSFGLELGHLSVGAIADLCIIDPKKSWECDMQHLASFGKNSPFERWTFDTTVLYTFINGNLVYPHENML